jgi:amidophosphoribosyltransferase
MSDKFHEECAVMGIFGHPEAANMVYLGLYALQHRGQESCGIVTSDGKGLISHRQMGLVADAFKEEVIKRLEGQNAIGHNRYSTQGQSHLKNAQPFVVEYSQDLAQRQPGQRHPAAQRARAGRIDLSIDFGH